MKAAWRLFDVDVGRKTESKTDVDVDVGLALGTSATESAQRFQRTLHW
jgi:hypothetical protein